MARDILLVDRLPAMSEHDNYRIKMQLGYYPALQLRYDPKDPVYLYRRSVWCVIAGALDLAVVADDAEKAGNALYEVIEAAAGALQEMRRVPSASVGVADEGED